MKKPGQIITCSNFKALRRIVRLTGIPGESKKLPNGQRQYRTHDGAVLNYWKSTKTINFQGRELPAAELKNMVLQRAIIIRVPVNTEQDAA